jgi:hypothetical protein
MMPNLASLASLNMRACRPAELSHRAPRDDLRDVKSLRSMPPRSPTHRAHKGGRACTDAPRARRRQIYNQIYNTTYSAFRQGTNPPPLNYSSPVLSHAVIQVSFSTRYFYQVSDANGVCTGPVYNFVSPPGAAPAPAPAHSRIGHVKHASFCQTASLTTSCTASSYVPEFHPALLMLIYAGQLSVLPAVSSFHRQCTNAWRWLRGACRPLSHQVWHGADCARCSHEPACCRSDRQ